ncbi:MAG: ATP-binding protein [Beijerinckiaceae bacterium]
MSFKKTASIRIRLILLVVITVTLAQSLSLGISVWQEVSRYAVAKRDALVSTAEVVAAAAARATAERDTNGAYQAIRAIGRISGITFAGIEDLEGRGFADVGATEQLESDLVITDPAADLSLRAVLFSRSIEIAVPVTYAGNRVGTLRLIADTSDLPGRIWSGIGATSLGALIALVLALGLAMRMQKGLTAPLLALTGAMSRVRQDHDYAIAMPIQSSDEVGVLVNGFNAMIGDIRERDERLARHLAGLETEVAERTADFRMAAAEAESANRAKSDFLATMSHEIRTPMNGILVMAEVLATAELPKGARRQAEVIARSGSSLLAIINDILDFSKIEAGKLDVETLDIDAAEAVDTVLRLFAGKAQSKDLDLCASLDLLKGAQVVADPVRLGQVLGNLVNNALKFTERGGVTVDVSPDRTDAGKLCFSVIDTGIGIPAEKLATIFEAFSQADQTTTRQFGGTGLGLTIARRLVAAMGGELKVESTAGVGARFFFSLPAASTTGLAAWPRLPAEFGSTERAILCLDGEQTAAVAAACLEAAGFLVERVAREALPERATGATMVLASAAALGGLPRLAVKETGAILVLTLPGEDPAELRNAGIFDASLSWPLLRTDLSDIVEALRDGRSPTLMQNDNPVARMTAAVFTGLKVLVADDSEVNREVAQAALQRLGITPDLVHDGREAIEAVFARRYDLVLMDGSMPDIDGFEATRLIRTREQAEGAVRTPVVALTAHVVGMAAEAWRTAGMDGVLHKPFTLAQMTECIRTHASGLTQASAADASVEAVKSSDAAPVLDISVLDELRQMTLGSPEVVRRIIRLYCTQSDVQIREIIEAVRQDNLDRLGSAAHALKSMSFNVGARRVADIAGELERLARAEGGVVGPDAVAELEAQVIAVKAALELQAA